MKWESVFAQQELQQMVTVFAKQMVLMLVLILVT
tara:strand:+ start:346 stop:447 length:102 start_codon:yes stop_codon:yes gene_type:complete